MAVSDKKPVVFGSSFTPKSGQDPIDALNERAFEIAKLQPDNPSWTHLRNGYPAYQRRFHWMVYGFLAYGTFGIGWLVYARGFWAAFCMALISFVYSDFKGGNLHVVLDYDANWDNPIFGDGAIEFQMHHAIPQDNVIKPFMEMCGDLNMYAMICMCLAIAVGGVNEFVLASSGFMVMFGYMGQWAHRCSHMQAKDRPDWVVFLQKMHLMVPPAVHAKHHQTYDDNFCILSGWTGGIISVMVRNIPSPLFWRNLFLFLSFVDISLVAEYFRSSYDVE